MPNLMTTTSFSMPQRVAGKPPRISADSKGKQVVSAFHRPPSGTALPTRTASGAM